MLMESDVVSFPGHGAVVPIRWATILRADDYPILGNQLPLVFGPGYWKDLSRK